MAITDAERHQLHSKLDVVLGPEDAVVLMSHLPPSGWSDVARTRDLDMLETRLNTRTDHVEARIGHVEAQIERLADRADVNHRFDLVDQRFATMEARIDASIERTIREQTSRFLVYTGAIVALATTVQGVVTELLGG